MSCQLSLDNNSKKKMQSWARSVTSSEGRSEIFKFWRKSILVAPISLTKSKSPESTL
ncbi:uncharacterized protein Dana_GF26727 [Drosophila ananassae]|uniref:Uncharacterized protein n=1 Tax=Drosophila ananassae TaxID=7217 RepID=A0A0P8XQJ6_DROAN|nr:uncharacterized protein Dana_GF26727 [Drosophila ananassae]